MAEPGFDVDVLVSHVDAPGKGHRSVDDHIFPVVPVILAQGHHREDAVKHPALDAQLFHALRVIRRKGEDGPHVVVDHPDLHPLLHLHLQHIQNGVPKLAFFNDEVFDEDIPLGPPQGGQNVAVTVVPQGVIVALGVAIHRAVGHLLQVVGHARCIRANELGQSPGPVALIPQVLAHFLLHDAQTLLVEVRQVVPTQEQIGQRPKGHQTQDNDNPADLIPWVALTGHNPHHHQNGQDQKGPMYHVVMGNLL